MAKSPRSLNALLWSKKRNVFSSPLMLLALSIRLDSSRKTQAFILAHNNKVDERNVSDLSWKE